MTTKILLLTEGTYPYNYGGVSSWCHILCSLTKNVEYSIYSFNAQFEKESKYEIPKNVKEIIQVPLWTPYSLTNIIDYGYSFSESTLRKKKTTTTIIEANFIEHFYSFVTNLISDENNLNTLENSIYKIWDYFKEYDFDITTRSLSVWECFKKIITEEYANTPDLLILDDVSFTMKYVIKLLTSLAIPIPKVDIVHLTISGVPIIPAIIAKREYGSAIITTEHGVYIREIMINISSSSLSYLSKKIIIRCAETLSRLTYHKSDLVTSVNEFNTQWEFKYGLDKNKSKIIYNGVDENKFNVGEKPKKLIGTPTVVAIARIFELKDILTMIKTCNYVKDKIPKVKFIVYGDTKSSPEYVIQCNELIKELKLSNNFELAGHHPTPNKAFLEGDISILTSISEGFPYTVIESMSCGIPVVATDAGGVSEAITEKTGYVCKPKDYKSLGAKVVFLLENETIRKKMGIESRKRVLENFTLDSFIESFEQTYKQLKST